jgi:hypothetical protein
MELGWGLLCQAGVRYLWIVISMNYINHLRHSSLSNIAIVINKINFNSFTIDTFTQDYAFLYQIFLYVFLRNFILQKHTFSMINPIPWRF